MATSRDNNLVPFMATHPLEVVEDEIKARGISKKEFAARIGMKPSNLSRMLRMKQEITASFAEKLEDVLGIDASFWLRMQSSYIKDVKAIEKRDAAEQSAYNIEYMLSLVLNMKELYSRLKINSSLFIQDKLARLEELFGDTPANIPAYIALHRGEYKRSDKAEAAEKDMNTWVAIAYISAKNKRPSSPFATGNARKAAREIADSVHCGLATEATISGVLDKYGISYSVVEKLEKTPVDGYSAWIGDYPAIVTTHRYNDMSKLVFNILHELGHIELHMGDGTRKSFVADDSIYSCEDVKEREANSFAENMLIDSVTWKKMMSSAQVKGLWSVNIAHELKKVAQDNHLDFGIVSWRYMHETNIYAIRGFKRIPIH